MTVDRELIATRIAKIREQLRHLSRLETVSREEFLTSPTEQHATERELQIVIEACLDMGHHVISREGLRRPGDYREVFAILREAGIIETSLGRRLEDMASFRNRLVHGYFDVQPGRVYEIARNELGDVEAFVASIVTRYVPNPGD
ncbi:MAG: type VII toxin-antitoxin system HepT family RNase toxin [Gaiellales bacterium]